MSREIKFRAWDKKRKKMRIISMLETDNEKEYMFPAQYYLDVEEHTYREGIELMQYTGLKDKNGKEIYEGDTFKWKRKIKKVVWYDKNLRWSAQNIEEDSTPKGLYHYKKYIKVIGNIYENPAPPK